MMSAFEDACNVQFLRARDRIELSPLVMVSILKGHQERLPIEQMGAAGKMLKHRLREQFHNHLLAQA